MILPPATLGMLGGGQLGRMFTVAARTLGYRVVVLDPDPRSPAGALADEHIAAPYDDDFAIDLIARTCAVVTTEFENVPSATLAKLAARVPVRPGPLAVSETQHRIREKLAVHAAGLRTAPFRPIRSPDELEAAWDAIGGPAMLKCATFGYDGKGQAVVHDLEGLWDAWERLGRPDAVLERRIDLRAELSVVLARGPDGGVATFPLAANVHVRNILHTTTAPAPFAPALADQARHDARTLAEALDYVGVMAVEFFVSQGGELLVNEIAPRPHNSGHYTVDACEVSQFAQQVRAICGLPLADTRLDSPVAMVNLLGDLWARGEPDWSVALRHPRAKLTLYGKATPRPGRKMGHLCVLADTADAALEDAEAIHAALVRGAHPR